MRRRDHPGCLHRATSRESLKRISKNARFGVFLIYVSVFIAAHAPLFLASGTMRAYLRTLSLTVRGSACWFKSVVRHSTRPEHPNRPGSGHPLPVQSTPSVQLWTPHSRPEQTKRPESGRFDTGQSTLTVQFLDALHLHNCVVFSLVK
jgi:hypothetical protein